MSLRAVLLARAGKFDEAAPVLRQSFADGSAPKAEIAEGYARVCLGTYQFSEAHLAIDRWMELAPEDVRPYLLRIEIYKRLVPESDVLVRDCREALKRDPSRGDIRLELAEKLLDGSKLDEADAEFATLLARQPRNAPGHVGSGRVALLKGDIQAARHHFEAALAIDGKSHRALCELAQLDLRFGQIQQARARIERAIAIDPHDFEARYTYSRILTAGGDSKGSAEQSESADRLRKELRHIDELRKSLVQRPDDLDLRSQVARWLIEHGHEEEGLDWTRLIITMQPNHPETCRFLADYHTRKGNQGLANYYRSLLP